MDLRGSIAGVKRYDTGIWTVEEDSHSTEKEGAVAREDCINTSL